MFLASGRKRGKRKVFWTDYTLTGLQHVYRSCQWCFKGPEIIVVPDRCLYNVTFAAIRDKSSRYWSDTLRIRIVSSLTTLKLIPDSSADYHSKTGALIAGKPSVSKCIFQERSKKPLSIAWFETGSRDDCKATASISPFNRRASNKAGGVRQRIHSVSPIHFAALALPSSTEGFRTNQTTYCQCP